MYSQSPQTKMSAFKCELWRDDEARSLSRFFTTRYVLRECVHVCSLQRLHPLLGNVLPSAAALVLPPGQIAALPVEWRSSTCMSALLLRPSFRRREEQSGDDSWKMSAFITGTWIREIVNILHTEEILHVCPLERLLVIIVDVVLSKMTHPVVNDPCVGVYLCLY